MLDVRSRPSNVDELGLAAILVSMILPSMLDWIPHNVRSDRRGRRSNYRPMRLISACVLYRDRAPLYWSKQGCFSRERRTSRLCPRPHLGQHAAPGSSSRVRNAGMVDRDCWHPSGHSGRGSGYITFRLTNTSCQLTALNFNSKAVENPGRLGSQPCAAANFA